MRAAVLVKALVGLAVLVEMTAFAGFTWLDREATLRRAAEDLGRVAVLMEEHTHATLQTNRLVLNQLAAMPPPGDLSDWRGTAADADRLADLVADIPDVQSVWIFDGAGRVALSTVPGAQDKTFADRDYFRVHVDDPHVGTYVSPLIWGRVTGGFLFAVSRAVRDGRGELRGVIEASIDSRHFSSFYSRITPSPGSIFGIYRLDGAVVMRVPLPADGPASEGLTIGRDTVQRIARQPVGTLRMNSAIDGVERLYAYRRLDGAPLIVATGQPVAQILAGWHTRALRNAGMAVGSTLVILLLGAAVLRSLGRERAAAEALAASHANEVLARAEAQTAAAAKSRFLAVASHDLRQPLQAMRLYFELVRNGVTDPQLHPALHGLERAIAAGQKLLHALLDVSRLDAGQVQPKTVAGPIQPILDDVAAACRPLAEAKGLRFRMSPVAADVETDPLLLGQVLQNLVGNAVKYTDRGGILVGCRRHGQTLSIEVWDTGVGIPASALSTIFDEFVQLGNDQRDAENGYGLGLSVVRRTLDLLGHPLRVRSAPGRGSVFAVSVPLVSPPRRRAGTPVADEAAA